MRLLHGGSPRGDYGMIDFDMSSFAFWTGIGASLGLWRVSQTSVKWLIPGLTALLGSLLGARLGYVALHWSYYQTTPLEIIQLWVGGYHWFGALIGWLIAVILTSVIQKKPFSQAAGSLAGLLLPLGAGIWLGCWNAGVGYAPLSGIGLFSPDEAGVSSLRFPLQPCAAMIYAIGGLALERFGHNWLPGRRAAVTGLLVSLTVLFFSFIWVDPSPRWAGLRPDSWFAIIGGAASLGGLIASYWEKSVA